MIHSITSWLKNKKTTINPIYDDKCFKYALIASLHHNEIKINLKRISNLKSFAD